MSGKPRECSRPAERRSTKRRMRPLLVLTVGLTPPDAYWLRQIERPQRFRFQPIGDFAQADNPELCRPREFVAAAVREARRLDPEPAGIVAFDDYPATLLALAIADKLALPGPSLAAAVLCSHKAWSRLLPRESVPAAVQRVGVFDLG